MCESFFASLECELLDRHRFPTQAAARLAVANGGTGAKSDKGSYVDAPRAKTLLRTHFYQLGARSSDRHARTRAGVPRDRLSGAQRAEHAGAVVGESHADDVGRPERRGDDDGLTSDA